MSSSLPAGEINPRARALSPAFGCGNTLTTTTR
nr:MAG TPA: hypothetical protein [Caudoviricetes sp.]